MQRKRREAKSDTMLHPAADLQRFDPPGLLLSQHSHASMWDFARRHRSSVEVTMRQR